MKRVAHINPVAPFSREAKCEFFYPASLHYPGGEVLYIYRFSSGGVPTTIRPPGSSEGYPTPTLDGDGGQVLCSPLICCHAQGGGGEGPVPCLYFPLLVGPSQLLLCSVEITGFLCINSA